MKIFSTQQGSDEWAWLRAGIPTASNFDKIITAGGAVSKQAEKYLQELLAERMMGHPVDDIKTSWMERGNMVEAEAVAFYEMQRDCDTEKVGFITNDAETWGASPDRLVGKDGLLEIKCPSPSVHVGYLMQSGSAYQEYRVQVQGQLWVAERQWSDILSFHPEMPMALHRIERDEKFIEKMAVLVEAFAGEVEQAAQMAKERGWIGKPEKPRTLTAAQMMREALLDMKREA
jgi:hypothetical protein